MDYYSTLGLKRGATDDEINKAYRSLAMKHHPDRGGDEAKFKEISSAYDALSDPEKKRIVDMGGDPNAQPGRGGGFNQGPFEFHFGSGNYDDVFNHFGFGGFAQRPMRRNKSLNINVIITLCIPSIFLSFILKKFITLSIPTSLKICIISCVS